MDIVPIITKDNLSKEQIEYLQKQKSELDCWLYLFEKQGYCL